jgi:hypothetical protein
MTEQEFDELRPSASPSPTDGGGSVDGPSPPACVGRGRPSADARSIPASLLRSWKGSSAAVAIEFHATRYLRRRAAQSPTRCRFRLDAVVYANADETPAADDEQERGSRSPPRRSAAVARAAPQVVLPAMRATTHVAGKAIRSSRRARRGAGCWLRTTMAPPAGADIERPDCVAAGPAAPSSSDRARVNGWARR